MKRKTLDDKLITTTLGEKRQGKERIMKTTEKNHTVEPRSNGPATNGIPPMTAANLSSYLVDFFYFFY